MDVFGGGQFDSDPTLTAGCSDAVICLAYTPFAYIDGIDKTDGFFSGNFNVGNVLLDYVDRSTNPPQNDTGERDHVVFADWKISQDPVSVPEPNMLMLLSAGFLGLVGSQRRRHASRLTA